jgi:hypothetical protein
VSGGGDHKQRASLPPVGKKSPRLAAGRARALGLPTRGTTNANRLRRVDRWLLATQVPRLRDAARPLVVDLDRLRPQPLQQAQRGTPEGAVADGSTFLSHGGSRQGALASLVPRGLT